MYYIVYIPIDMKILCKRDIFQNGIPDCVSRRDSISHSALETQSNAYATINKLPMAGSSRRSLFNGSLDITDHNESRDYATLEKSYRLGSIIVNFN